MAAPISHSAAAFPDPGNIPVLARQLQQQLETFHDLLPPRPDQIALFAQTTLALSEASRSVLATIQNPTTRLMEDVQNAADTARTILQQSLDIMGATKGVSLLSAAEHLPAQEIPSSDLNKIAQTFSKYPEQTASLKLELQHAIDDLKKDQENAK